MEDGAEWLSPFIFVGVVERRFAATMDVVPVSEASAVVKVVEVFKAPPVLGDLTGRAVTVELAEPDEAAAGKPMLFLADGWLLGEGIALVGVTEMPRLGRGEVRKRIEQAERRKADDELAARVARADVIVAAAVRETRPSEEQRPGVSEHEPDWWEALLDVESVEKGKQRGERLTVLFPNSHDEMWIDSPKLEPGLRAVFLLQRNQREKGWPAFAMPGLTALHPLDVQPLDQLDRVRSFTGSR